MIARIRKYLPAIGTVLFVFLLAAMASAGPGREVAEENVPDHVQLPENAEAEDGLEVQPLNGEGDPAPESTDNHGACVSQAAKDGAVEGFRHGGFVSSVGQDESMKGDDCDYSAQLQEAQELELPRGADEQAGADADRGSSHGQQKAEEARDRGGHDNGEE